MKKLNKLELVGMILGIIGAIMIILNAFIKEGPLLGLLKYEQLFFWTGILVWSFGYMRKEQEEKEKTS